MKRRILLIIIILILLILGIAGSLYFISYKNDSKAKSEDENFMPENTINTIEDDTNTVGNEVESNPVEENTNEEITETSNTNTEVTETAQTTTQQTSTKTNSSSSNNNSSTQKKETVTQSTSQSTSTTPTSTPTTTETTSQSSSSQSSSKTEETKTESKVERCTNNNNHGMDIGNSGKWFNSKSEAVEYYNSQVSYWGNQWEADTIDDATYYKNCPTGYEVWSCMYCSKWTINFYYR